MKLSGMDADAVESAASNLHRASGDLQGTAGRISAAVGEASPDAATSADPEPSSEGDPPPL